MSGPGPVAAGRLVKVVVWDLDGTLWPGVALESAGLPPVRPEALSALDTLAGRGILVSVATRNPAEVGALVEASPALAGRFVAPQYGWGRKVDALRRIADELDVRLDSVAFVDDDPLERADVERSLPEVVVLAPEEVPDALAWPDFDPGPVTAAARSRGQLPAAGRAAGRPGRLRRRRAGLPALVRAAGGAAPGGAGRRGPARRARPPDDPVQLDRRRVPARRPGGVLELTDRFGDDGLVGVATVPSRTVRSGRPSWWRCRVGPAAGGRCRCC